MMRYLRTLGLLLITLVVFTSVAGATSLSTLIGQNGTIVIGDKTFGNFGFNCTAGDCASESITPANIQVDAFIDDQTGVYYLQFSGDMISGSDVEFILQYTVTASAGLINMIDQSFSLSVDGTGGTIIIGENAMAGSFLGTIVANSSISFSDLQDPTAEVGDDLIIDPALAKIWVEKDINLDVNTGGHVGTSVLKQSFHQTVPEPTSLLLLGTGLTGLALWRKKAS